MALDLLAMEQPMAIDLRFILSVIRINADLERVGDQAVNIAMRVREMGASDDIDLPVDIPKLAQLSSAMVRKALQAFIEADAEMAQSVLLLDDQVDEMNDAAFYSLSALIKEKPELTPPRPERADHRAQPGTRRRPRDQHRGGRDLLGARGGCPAPLRRERRCSCG